MFQLYIFVHYKERQVLLFMNLNVANDRKYSKLVCFYFVDNMIGFVIID
jgi:hypothetical protein